MSVTLIEPHTYMCKLYRRSVDRTALTVNEQLLSREAPTSMTLGVVQWYFHGSDWCYSLLGVSRPMVHLHYMYINSTDYCWPMG